MRTLPAGPSPESRGRSALNRERLHDDDDAMPPPPGPPPGFEIVIPEAEKGENEAVDAPETNAGDDDDDGDLSAPPLSPPGTACRRGRASPAATDASTERHGRW